MCKTNDDVTSNGSRCNDVMKTNAWKNKSKKKKKKEWDDEEIITIEEKKETKEEKN
jgi:hypothetical protein